MLVEAEKAKARQELIDNLMDRHGTGRVLFRNTRAAIKGFPVRNLHVSMPIPSQYATSMRVSGLIGGKISQEARAQKTSTLKRFFKNLRVMKPAGGSLTHELADRKIKLKRSEKILSSSRLQPHCN